ncbi:unnamed protein product [Lactuca saligna]|uniref:Uncharacterized protein n=1 Tax=Lactuca saligna TaxID=75948 RepID=A0AA35ZWI9_LACSI|nr:unnamed protein product [Lactuca saligna]
MIQWKKKKSLKLQSVIFIQEEISCQIDFEEIGILSSSMKTSTVDTTTILGDLIKPSIPKQTSVIPPEVSITKSFHEEVRTSGISTHVSNMDVNVNMGEGVSKNGHPVSTQGIRETSVITTTTSLPSFVSTVTTTIHSPTFDQVMNQPITYVFPSQFTNPPKLVNGDETDDEVFGGSFLDHEFDHEEEVIPNHMLMSGKQFKILNRKLNSLLQSQVDVGSKHSVLGIEVDIMLKAQEHQLQHKLDSLDKTINSMSKLSLIRSIMKSRS